MYDEVWWRRQVCLKVEEGRFGLDMGEQVERPWTFMY